MSLCDSCAGNCKTGHDLCYTCYLTTHEGKRHRRTDGYMVVNYPGHPRCQGDRPYVMEHIIVMEEILDRFLEPGENVHHMNGVRDDNRPENLELWMKPQPSGIRLEDAVQQAIELLRKHDPMKLRKCFREI